LKQPCLFKVGLGPSDAVVENRSGTAWQEITSFRIVQFVLQGKLFYGISKAVLCVLPVSVRDLI